MHNNNNKIVIAVMPNMRTITLTTVVTILAADPNTSSSGSADQNFALVLGCQSLS